MVWGDIMFENKSLSLLKYLSILILVLSLFTLFYTKAQYTMSQNLLDTIIIIDAGHGYPDGGTSSKSGIQEHKINLEIAKKLKKILIKNGATVVMTRNDEHSLSDSKTNNKREDLNKRVKIRDNSGGSIFISIHLNHFSDSKYSGAQVFYNTNSVSSKLLAETIQESLIKNVDTSNSRKAKGDNTIFVLKNSKIPSILVECGFLSNIEEAEKLSDSKYQKKLANAIYKGIEEYIK